MQKRIQLQTNVKILKNRIDCIKSQMMTLSKPRNKKVKEIVSDIFTLGQINMLLGNQKKSRWGNKYIEAALSLLLLPHFTAILEES